MKRLLIAVSLALTGVSAVTFYYWQQATQLPTWYTSSQPDSSIQPSQTAASTPTVDRPTTGTQRLNTSDRPPSGSQPSAIAIQQAKKTDTVPQTPSEQPTKAQRHQKELTRLFTNEIARKAESKKLGTALKGTNTTMQNGNVESGAVVNFKDISPEQLPPDERAFFTKLVTAFPALSQQSFYIGIEGKPTVKNGQAQLDNDVRIKLGNLSFTPAQLSERLGIPEAQIRQQIQLQVQLGNQTTDQLQMVDDSASKRSDSN